MKYHLLGNEVKINECKIYLHRSVPGVFGNQQANYLDLIKQMLQQSVLDMANYEVIYSFYKFVFLVSLLEDRYTSYDKIKLLVT